MARLRLLCGEMLHRLRNGPVTMITDVGKLIESTSKHPMRQQLVLPLLPLIHRAEKYIFDSGSDTDERTTSAIRDTAVNMMEAGLFHQPFPLMWIEDPFEDMPDQHRNFYLTQEFSDHIDIWMFVFYEGMAFFQPYKMLIDLLNPSDEFAIPGMRVKHEIVATTYAETVYSYKKFIVALGASNTIRETIGLPKAKPQGARKDYAHHIVYIPLESKAVSESTGSGAIGGRRRQHLVAGYVYGKNTRPKEQQRWVAQYWRGDAELGKVEHSHHRVS